MLLRVAVHGISHSGKGKPKFRITCCLDSYRSSSSWNWSDNRSSEKLSKKVKVVSPISVDAQIQKQVLDKCAALHASIMPLNEKVRSYCAVYLYPQLQNKIE